MSYHQKRKRKRANSSTQPQFRWLTNHANSEDESPGLEESIFVEAHEADVVVSRGAAAILLEAPPPGTSAQPEKGTRGSALVKWGGSEEGDEVWVDRYDARLLLSSSRDLPQNDGCEQLPPSPTGWSDLPSDTEDTFFLAAEEIVNIRREKRRRLLDKTRSERLRALQATDPNVELAPEEIWGDDTEEPDDAQKQLMKRTAAHLASSPNPIQLETRILANHGADKRFAFLRGRWRNAWTEVKNEARIKVLRKKEEEKEKAALALDGSGLTGLADYGDSDEQDSGDDEGRTSKGAAKEDVDVPNPPPPEVDDEAKKEARRARAREWASKRRADKN